MYKIFCDGKIVYHPLREQNQILSGKLDREVNKAGKLTFKIPEDNECYGLIHLMKSTVTVYENDKLKFRGRPYVPSLNLYKDNEIVCEGELAFLNDIQYPPFSFYGTVEKFLTDLITFYNSKVPANRQFKVGIVNVTNNTIEGYITRSSEDYMKVWQLINEKLIEMLGGFLHLRHETDGVYIDYLKELNFAGNQPVEQGLNLIDARETTNPESLATVIIPLGAKLLDEDGNETEERLTIEALTGSKYIESEDGIEEFGRIEKTFIHDDITIVGNLEAAGRMDLAAALGAQTTLELTAADLSKAGYDVSSFEVGTLVHTKVKNLGIDKRLLVRKLSEDLLNPEANRLTIGDSIRRFTSRLAKVKDGKDGKPGKPGAQGISAVSVRPQFYSSISNEVVADGEWSYTQPTYEDGKYLWMRDETTWSDETVSYSEPYYAGALDSANKAAQDALIEVANAKLEHSTIIEQAEERILSEVSETYCTQEQATVLIEQNKLAIEQSANAFDLNFQELEKRLDGQTEVINERERYIRMIEGEIHIGEVGDPMVAVHTKESLEFRYNGVVIARFTKKTLEVDNAHVKNQLRVQDNWALRRGAQIIKDNKIVGNNLNIMWM